MKCTECNNANICLDHIRFPSLYGCTSGIPDHKVTTNADRIRNMSNEELAESIMCPAEYDLGFNKEFECNGEMNRNCRKCTLNWLQSEAE